MHQYQSYVQSIIHALATLSLIAGAVTLPSCGGSEEAGSGTAEQYALPVDPRFASADALVDYVNTLNEQRPVPVRDLMSLIYAENEWQREFVELANKAMNFVELQQEFWERWRELLAPDPNNKPRNPVPPDGPAEITSREDQRVIAQYKDFEGIDKQLHFVRIGPRWWVSGYTFEYDEQAVEYKRAIAGPIRWIETCDQAAKPLLRRMKSGEFANAEEARNAFLALLPKSPQ